ncbi:hypothetical protein ACFYZB_44205 [Streptomyces sp. NPDC001852]|uniref:hypothetical protein n=1 Tax=Streptomyces sp. NPDC001852 TaxID=3364619 RepID=UPI0036789BC4
MDLEITERIQAFEEAEAALDAQELAHIARTPDEKAPGVHAPHARLLLLLPVLGDADLPSEAVELVGAALVQTGVAAGNAASLAQALLRDPDTGSVKRLSWSTTCFI